MKSRLLFAVSAVALASLAAPASAQRQPMPGMTMPPTPKPEIKPHAATPTN